MEKKEVNGGREGGGGGGGISFSCLGDGQIYRLWVEDGSASGYIRYLSISDDDQDVFIIDAADSEVGVGLNHSLFQVFIMKEEGGRSIALRNLESGLFLSRALFSKGVVGEHFPAQTEVLSAPEDSSLSFSLPQIPSPLYLSTKFKDGRRILRAVDTATPLRIAFFPHSSPPASPSDVIERLIFQKDISQISSFLQSAEMDCNQPAFSTLLPLHAAAFIPPDFASLVSQLVGKGADVNAADFNGNTALHYAASARNVLFFDELLRHGAILSVENDEGTTPLHLLLGPSRSPLPSSSLPTFLSLLRRVLSLSPSLANHPNRHKATPLHFLCRNEALVRHVLPALLEVPDIEIDRTDNQNMTPLHIVLVSRNMEAFRMLLRKGADVSADLRQYILTFQMKEFQSALMEEISRLGSGKKSKSMNFECLDLENIPGVSNPESIRRLNLQKNKISRFTDISHFANLRKLYLSGNDLAEWPPSLTRLTHLQELDLSHNRIGHVPPSLLMLYHLKVLNVSFNGLSQISFSFWFGCAHLEELYIQGNRLRSLDDPANLVNDTLRLHLVVLDASQNLIQRTPKFLVVTPSLTYLNLSGNPLVDVPAEKAANPSSFLTYLRQRESQGTISRFAENAAFSQLNRNKSSQFSQPKNFSATPPPNVVVNAKVTYSPIVMRNTFTIKEKLTPPEAEDNPRLRFLKMKSVAGSFVDVRAATADPFTKDLTDHPPPSPSTTPSALPPNASPPSRTLTLSVENLPKKPRRVLKKREGTRTPGQVRQAKAIPLPLKDVEDCEATDASRPSSPSFYRIPTPITLPHVTPRFEGRLANSGATRLDSVLTSSLSPRRSDDDVSLEGSHGLVDLVRLCDGWCPMNFDYRFTLYEYVCPASLSTNYVGPIIPEEVKTLQASPDTESELASFFLRNAGTPFEEHVVRLINIGVGSQFAYFFSNCSHLNFYTQTESPIYVTIGCEPVEFPSSEGSRISTESHFGYLLLVRKALQDVFTFIEIPPKKKAKILVPRDAIKLIKTILEPSLRSSIRSIENPESVRIHLEFERKLSLSNYKIGVLHCPSGSCDEDAMYSSQGSNRFYDFLSILGEVVILRSWGNYAGGLDVKADTTGRQSVYTRFFDFEIMFHVSTLLPLHQDDPQRLERKRHIGNDAVVVVFVEEGTFCPEVLFSKYIQVLVVVRHMMRNGKGHYQVSVISKTEVGNSFPSTLQDSVTLGDDRFRDAFLALLINCERAVLASVPKFSNLLEKSRMLLLKDMIAVMSDVPKEKEKVKLDASQELKSKRSMSA